MNHPVTNTECGYCGDPIRDAEPDIERRTGKARCRPCANNPERRRRYDAHEQVADMLGRVAAIERATELVHRGAIHEAAHTVVAVELGMEVSGIAIGEDQAVTGVYVDDDPTRTAAVYIAGVLAEQRAGYSNEVDQPDEDAIHDAIEAGADFTAARHMAQDILTRRASTHTALVDALVRHRQLDADQVSAIVAAHTPATPALRSANRDRTPLARPRINNGQPTWRDTGRPANWTEEYYQTWRAMHIAGDDGDNALFRNLQSRLIDMDKTARKAA